MPSEPNEAERLPERARLVIIGAGVVGSSAAHFLTQKGWRDIVVLERGPLFEVLGSTSHAPGLVFQLNASKSVCQLARWSVELYSQLSAARLPCFYPVGSLEIAYTSARHEELKRKLGHCLSWGLPAQIIGPEEVRRKIPILRTEGIPSALYVPSDGVAKGSRICEALAARASQGGAAFFGRTEVTGFEIQGGVRAVLTSRGRIETEQVLLCAGVWGPQIGRKASVVVPLVPVQHQCAKTGPLRELAGETREIVHPILRHQDRSMYFRQHADCYGIGSYQHVPLLVDIDDLQDSAVREFTASHFEKAWADATELFPSFRGIDLGYRINGIFAFTPDGQSLVGQWSELPGFWVAEAVWVTHAGGIGRVIAELMTDGIASLDLRELDCNRFHIHARTRAYLVARGAQQYREVYDIIHPLQPLEFPRNLRCSPFHCRQRELGAVFFEGAGWERPQWFTQNEPLVRDWHNPGRAGWNARFWSPIAGAEHEATRERIGLFDLTPFTKIEVSGPGALCCLQRLTANQMNRPVGKVTYTSMLNERGGIECDLTVTRLDSERFLVITGAATGPRDLRWIHAQVSQNDSARVLDVTSAYCCIGVWGPASRDLVQSLSENDFSNHAFPYMTARQVHIGCVPALAVRISYVGELGWEIYAPYEYGLQLWDTLWDAGQPYGAVVCGGAAFDSLRLEKGYRLWGVDIHSEYNPFEAGLAFAVRLEKGDFQGREALQQIQQEGVRRKLCCLTLDSPAHLVMGKEPVMKGETVLGYVTSANYGYSVRRSIAYAYVPVSHASMGTELEIYYFGQRYPATVSAEPLYDAENRKLRC